MGVDVSLKEVQPVEVYSNNITHNLIEMAEAVGLYKPVWRPDAAGIATAKEMIEPLRAGIAELKSDSKKYKRYDAPNGWGTYEDFVPWLEQYLQACEEYPDAVVSAGR